MNKPKKSTKSTISPSKYERMKNHPKAVLKYFTNTSAGRIVQGVEIKDRRCRWFYGKVVQVGESFEDDYYVYYARWKLDDMF